MTGIRKTAFLCSLKTAERNRVFALARTARWRKGEMIFSKDEAGDNFFIVKSGRVRIFTSVQPERAKTLAYLGAGDFFGEMALLGGEVRSASACAEEDCELRVINGGNFKKLLRADHAFTLNLLRTLCERLHKADDEIEGLLFHNMIGRLAGAIVKLRGERKFSPVPAEIDINISQLAQYIGATREPVSRAVSALKRAKMIDYRAGKIAVLDVARLRAISPQKK
ncbi:MAG: Crp/Fnr family transcriptional regulator [Elusimicrobiales bacterium]